MKKLISVGVLGILAVSATGWALHRPANGNRRFAARTQAQKADPLPEQPASRTVALDADAVKDMGLRITVLKPVRHVPELRTVAVVLSPQALTTWAATYVTDTKNLAMARAGLAVARHEYQRQNVLYHENQNTSLMALQAARGTLTSSQAQTVALQRQLQLDTLGIEQQWGPVLRKWLVARSPTFEKILGQQEWLVQVTLVAGDPRSAPPIARLVTPSGSAVPARLVSSFPQINPVIQGLNFLYVIPARPGFAPGLNLVAEIPAGPARSGVVIPAAAVVWSQGQAWAYQETAPNRFRRLVVPTDKPVADGWFVTAGFLSGDRIVTHAVEELFSAETLAVPGNQGGEGDDD
ncbi:MAG TPA: hypothetical protein VNJ12_13750 [Candidatus Dormibacteraeota bacterium]|nr:hypothetical protein [Candidatus Dormibacteraeota bacterium]